MEMAEEKNWFSECVAMVIASIVMTIFYGFGLQWLFSPETEFMKQFIWIGVGGFFAILCVFYIICEIAGVLKKASEDKNDQFNLENPKESALEEPEPTPKEKLKWMLEEELDKCEPIMANRAKETFLEFERNFTITTGSSSKAREPKGMMMANEVMYHHLQKQAALLKTIDMNSVNIIRVKALKLSQKFNENSVILEPFRQELLSKGVPLSIFKNIAEKAESFIRMFKEANDYTSQQLGIIGAGMIGEQRIEKAMLRTNHIFDYFMNVRLEYNGESIETDCLVICSKGIYLIEGKNYGEHGNYGLHITSDGQWRKTFKDGSSVALRKDFIDQVNRQMFGVQKVILSELKEKGQSVKPEHFHSVFHPAIVIANDSVEIVNDTSFPIIRPSLIYQHIMDHPDVLKKDQIKELIEIIENKMLPPQKFSTMDYMGAVEDNYNLLLKYGTLVDYIDKRYKSYSDEVKGELLVAY